MTLKIDSNGLISLKGKSISLEGLDSIQAQCVLLKLGFNQDCLFDVLCEFEENGWNETLLGLTGSFIYGEYKGEVQ